MKKLSVNLVSAILVTVAIIGGVLISDNVEIFYSGYFAGMASTIVAALLLDDED